MKGNDSKPCETYKSCCVSCSFAGMLTVVVKRHLDHADDTEGVGCHGGDIFYDTTKVDDGANGVDDGVRVNADDEDAKHVAIQPRMV